MMAQTKRIVLNPKYVPKADEVLKKTGIENCSQLFSIFLVNFGDELVKRLQGEGSENEQPDRFIDTTDPNSGAI